MPIADELGEKLMLERSTRAPEPDVPSAYARRRFYLAIAFSIFCLVPTVVPVYRAFHRVQVNYNEGWNVYLADAAAHHLPLYTAKYSWTPVVYPALSFYMMAEISKITHEYIYTARVVSLLSLLLCCILVGAITKKITGATLPAFLSGCFCLALFCVSGGEYIGMDDPQMLAQIFFLAGMLLYVSRKPDAVSLSGSAFLFAVAGSIKHTPVYFPLAVLIDLFFVSRRRAVQFLAYGALFLGAAIFFNIHVGGPFFIANILLPRVYSFAMGVSRFFSLYGRLELPLLGTAFAVTLFWKNAAVRPISIWFALSLGLGILFAGGSGVNVNAFFGNFLAMAVLVGVLIDYVWKLSSANAYRFPWLETGVPVALFASLLVPLQASQGLRPDERFHRIRLDQGRFQKEVRVLQDQPGPALCTSLLRCYAAGKPYLVSPFDSTSLVLAGKLDPGEIVNKIEKGEYGAIQLDNPATPERSPKVIVDAVAKYYVPILTDPDCVIYIPEKARASAAQTVGLYR